ncbi:hypothetical protein BW730_06300 [Tessaracoccus aquimaris]|uniref:Uncharacterized protein n=1 Tax=Tessaracoccus aquimaris TaxID=1332264 RepID=A0A1Q2CM48_9ACTN|nr:hypothetical protein [Tessaracoccus aquimaris]AQP47182.1 hypothetical protein BW730_06300 [Tessaracoccus aquimaris]
MVVVDGVDEPGLSVDGPVGRRVRREAGDLGGGRGSGSGFGADGAVGPVLPGDVGDDAVDVEPGAGPASPAGSRGHSDAALTAAKPVTTAAPQIAIRCCLFNADMDVSWGWAVPLTL